MRSKLLQNAFLLSTAVHLAVLLCTPGPDSRANTAQPLWLHVALPPAPSGPEPSDLASTDATPAPAAVDTDAVDTSAVDTAPVDTGDEDTVNEEMGAAAPETAPAPEDEDPPEPPTVFEAAEAELETLIEQHSPPAQRPSEPPADESEAETPADEATSNETEADAGALDPAELQRCLEETARIVETQKSLSEVRRYRFLVRERVRDALLEHLPQIAPQATPAAGNDNTKDRQSALLTFRVEEEGYLFHLSLRALPGSDLPGAQLQRVIEALSPFPPPPAGAPTPLAFQFELILR